MYLKSLEIHGFKSFADRTKIDFHPGVTGIVGPNGCGKSNVVDAIRWVLGETSAKALRGGEMADVIFNGTEKRRPLGMAEVTLTMADCEEALKVDYNEVALTRRVYRDGKSEYRINGTLCRLKDIHDLLMDTGIGRTAYSIMAQGQIDQILSSKPEERRSVFEEAAGITKYKREKKEALRKLEFTEANLLRVSDVLAEQERRINSLRRQVSKARRFQSLSADVRTLDTHLGHRRYIEQTTQQEQLKQSIQVLDLRETELQREMGPKEEAVNVARSAARHFEAELAELRQALNGLRNAANSAEGRIAFNEERKAELEHRTIQNREEIEITHERILQQEQDLVMANEALSQIMARLSDLEYQLAQQEEVTASAKSQRLGFERELDQLRHEESRLQSQIAGVQARIESSYGLLEANRERAQFLAGEEQRLRSEMQSSSESRELIHRQIQDFSAQRQELDAACQQAELTCRQLRQDLGAARLAFSETQKALAQKSSRLEVLRQLVASGEGFELGTRSVLAGLGDPERFSPSIKGALAEMIQVREGCGRAIELALAENLQAILVADEKAADAILTRLTEKKLGQAALLPLTLVRAVGHTAPYPIPDGSVAWASDCVTADERIAPVLARLLGNILIAPNYATAIRLHHDHPGIRIITQAGTWISGEGVIHGGDAGEGDASLLERQNEIRQLDKQVEALGNQELQARELVSSLDDRLANAQRAFDASREAIQRHQVELTSLKNQASLIEREVDSFLSKLDQLHRESAELSQREHGVLENRSLMEEDLTTMRVRLSEISESQHRQQMDLADLQRQEEESSAALQEMRTALAVESQARLAAQSQQQPMQARLLELRETLMRREHEIESFVQRLESATVENQQLAEEAASKHREADEMNLEIETRAARRVDLIDAIEQAEIVLTEARKSYAHAFEQRGKEEISLTKIELKLESLVNGIRERYQVELAEFQPDREALFTSIDSQKNGQGEEQSVTFSENSDEDDDSAVMVVDDTRPPMAKPQKAALAPDAEPDWKFIENCISDLRRRLDSMGPVNLDAIQEFEELEARYNDVKSNYEDLMHSKQNLIDVIERINTETKRRFAETFSKVRENFREMFRELFGEQGKADLVLIDENDPLESGIEIIAKPPGKKLQTISLLSGGERSMTAVALLFSIYMIKPSPFCVLDELDAPLDESNINRFVKVLDRFIDRSQFIIVTHSKRTMARADVMYGVTMEEFGVSKPVGMRLTNAETSPQKGEARTAAQKAALRLDA